MRIFLVLFAFFFFNLPKPCKYTCVGKVFSLFGWISYFWTFCHILPKTWKLGQKVIHVFKRLWHFLAILGKIIFLTLLKKKMKKKKKGEKIQLHLNIFSVCIKKKEPKFRLYWRKSILLNFFKLKKKYKRWKHTNKNQTRKKVLRHFS